MALLKQGISVLRMLNMEKQSYQALTLKDLEQRTSKNLFSVQTVTVPLLTWVHMVASVSWLRKTLHG